MAGCLQVGVWLIPGTSGAAGGVRCLRATSVAGARDIVVRTSASQRATLLLEAVTHKQETIAHQVGEGGPQFHVGELQALLCVVVVTHTANDVHECHAHKDDDEDPAAAEAIGAAATGTGLARRELQHVTAIVGRVLNGLQGGDAVHTLVAVEVEVHLALVLGARGRVESAPEGVTVGRSSAQEASLHTTGGGVGRVQERPHRSAGSQHLAIGSAALSGVLLVLARRRVPARRCGSPELNRDTELVRVAPSG